MWIPCFIPLYSPLNLFLIILWILDFKYILLLLLLNNKSLELKSEIHADPRHHGLRLRPGMWPKDVIVRPYTSVYFLISIV